PSKDAHSVFGNPQFTNVSTADFHIASTSPAKDAGDPVFTAGTNEVDMDNGTRLFNNIVDMGADEYETPTDVNNIFTTNELILYPNPAKNQLSVHSYQFTGKEVSIVILDMTGREVLKSKIR